MAKFPETTERPGNFVAFVDNVGDALTFKILKYDLSNVLHRSGVRSASYATHRNKRVTLKSDLQLTLDRLDARPTAIIARGSQPK
jgi:hypothetical protein